MRGGGQVRFSLSGLIGTVEMDVGVDGLIYLSTQGRLF